MRTVYYAAVSADGFIATSDGSVAWLDPFQSPELGYEEFLASVGAVVLGRATFETALSFGEWPYHGKRGLVVTSHTLELPPDVRGVSVGGLPEAMRELRAESHGDVWIVGGGQTVRACLDAGLVDELELYVVPRLLGTGIPLVSPREALIKLERRDTRTFGNGITMLRFGVGRL